MEIKKILTTYNVKYKNNIHRIKYIVIHFFGDLGTAESVARYFASMYLGASAHYSVDESPIVYQSVEDEDIAWHCGTRGTYYHPDCRNLNSIGIEVRPTKIDKSSLSAEDKDWYFLEQTIINTIQLVKSLMVKYGVPIENVVRHYDVTHKYCPRPFVGDDINTFYKVSGNTMWNQFKDRLQNGSEEDDMDISKLTDAQVDQLIEKIVNRLALKPVSDYALTSSQKGVSSGLFADGNKDGLIDNPQAFVKRQDLAVILDKAGLLEKK